MPHLVGPQAPLYVIEESSEMLLRNESDKCSTDVDKTEWMEMMSQIIDDSAHDCNNLLAMLRSYPELIRLNYHNEVKVLKYLNAIESAADKMADRNRDLIILGKRGRYNRYRLQMNDIIESVIRRTTLSPIFQIRRNFAQDLLPVQGGREELERLCMHLLNCTGDTKAKCGVITIKTENYYLDHSVQRYRVRQQGEYVKLTIRTTNIDYKPASAGATKTTWENFNTENISFLGKQLIQQVVNEHGGWIDWLDDLGEENEMYVYLPTARECISGKAADSSTASERRILVIDDDPNQLLLLKNSLSNGEYQIDAVENGKEAINSCKKSQNDNRQFDLLLMDIVQDSGVDQIETYKTIRNIFPNQKTILFSGFIPQESVRKLQELGAGPYIQKPINLKVLSQTIGEMLEINSEPTMH